MEQGHGVQFEVKDLGRDGCLARIFFDSGTWERRFRYERSARVAISKQLAVHESPALKERTLREYSAEWMDDHVVHECTKETRDDYAKCYRRLVDPRLGDVLLSQLTATKADAFVHQLFSEGSFATANRGRRTLSAMLGVAESWGYVPRNPVWKR